MAKTNPVVEIERFKGLVIVESPAKAKTLKKYLGKRYDVKSSVGHIKDLPKSSLGVDVENNFSPTYEWIEGKEKKIEDIKEAAGESTDVYLAADPDREGEAIAWHVAQEIRGSGATIHRVLFNEITKDSVLKAIENPTTLDKDKYESQQARRILDRLVGYKISPILWTKVRRGLSAGRVQSVAVRMIADREKEIRSFVPQAYWSIAAALLSTKGQEVLAKLVKVEGKRLDRLDINTEEWANEIVSDCQKANYSVTEVVKKERKRKPSPPFITSTMQQEAAKKLYFPAKKTMRTAQQLYEGVEIGEEGAQGLITYMRTDSLRVSDQALDEVRKFVKNKYGDKYLPDSPNVYKNKRNAQDAHEAIRPTSLKFTPEHVKPFLDEDQFKLYELVWRRFLASQMSDAIFDQTTIDILAQASSKQYGFRTTGSILKFSGFLELWQIDEEEDEESGSIPDLKADEKLTCKEVKSEKHFTQPPPRYSESSMVKELEEKGIGRPSTYATILSTIQDRKYVEKKENRFYPTELGELVTELLVENFGNIVDEQFTAQMEGQLDQIEEGKANWVQTLKTFYQPFEGLLEVAKEKMRNVKREEKPTNLNCPQCSKPLVLKWGKNGRFVACQGYPECRFTSEYVQNEDGTIKLVEKEVSDKKCPQCDSAMIVKSGRFGRFLACSNYPTCKSTMALTTGIECPECKKGELAEKRSRFGKIFYSCTKYPECKYAIWDKPIKEPCSKCGSPFMLQKTTKRDGTTIRCPNKDCGHIEPEKVQATGTEGATV